MSRRLFLLACLAVCLVVAGGVSLSASSAPDGLEHVAEQTGFADAADESATAGSPMADYTTAGVADEGLATGIAGVAGSLAVLALAGGLFWLLGRRRGAPADGQLAPASGRGDGS